MDMTGPVTDMILKGIAHSDKTGPLTDAAIKYFTTTFVTNFITALPVIAIAGVCVYACLGMFSKKVAKMGVFGVLIYGVLVIL